MIRFACPSCGMAVSAPEECAGRSTKCRGCNSPIVVPQVRHHASAPPARPPTARDKTALGQVISHNPTGVKPSASAKSSPAPRNYPPAKPRKPATKSAAPAHQDAVRPRKRSILVTLGMVAGGLVLVFGAGGLFGFGVYRYLNSQKDPGDGPAGDSYALAPVKPDTDRSQPPYDSAPEKQPPKVEKSVPPESVRPQLRREEPPPTPRKEQPPPREEKEEDPAPPMPPRKVDPPPKPDPVPKPAPPEPTSRPEPTPKPEPMPEPKPDPAPKPEPKPEPPKPDPASKPEPRPDPAPKPEPKPEPPPRKEGPRIDERLKPFVTALKSNKPQERIQALEELGKLKEAARPVAASVCETLVGDKSPPVRQAAIAALEQIHPELHAAVVVLAVEAESRKHAKAARDIAALGEQGRAAVPVLMYHIRTATTRFANEDEVAVALIGEDALALAQVASDDAAVQRTLISLTRFKFTSPRYQRDIGQPARAAAVRALDELLDKHPEEAKHVVPGLITATRGMTDAEVTRPNGTYFSVTPLAILRFISARGLVSQS
jgi:hypothetical protein